MDHHHHQAMIQLILVLRQPMHSGEMPITFIDPVEEINLFLHLLRPYKQVLETLLLHLHYHPILNRAEVELELVDSQGKLILISQVRLPHLRRGKMRTE